MTLFKTRKSARSVDAEAAHGASETDMAMIVVLTLIFAPIVAMHVIFTFGDKAVAAPAATERPATDR